MFPLEDAARGATYIYRKPTPQAYQEFVERVGHERIYQGTMEYSCAPGLTQKCLTDPEFYCEENPNTGEPEIEIGKLRCTYDSL